MEALIDKGETDADTDEAGVPAPALAPEPEPVGSTHELRSQLGEEGEVDL